MSEWISIKDELPPTNVVVWMANTRGDVEKSKEKAKLTNWEWKYPSGLFAYSIDRHDIWKMVEKDE